MRGLLAKAKVLNPSEASGVLYYHSCHWGPLMPGRCRSSGLTGRHCDGESGEVSEFNVAKNTVNKTGESLLASNAHVAAVNRSTQEIYFPLMNVNGKPGLRIMHRQWIE